MGYRITSRLLCIPTISGRMFLRDVADFVGTTCTDRSSDRTGSKRRNWLEHTLPVYICPTGTHHTTRIRRNLQEAAQSFRAAYWQLR
jgi:hypothetical protein